MFDSQRSKICGSVNFRSHLLSANQQQQRNGTMYTMCAPRMENSYPSGIWKQSPHMTTSARNFCSGQKIESPAVSNLSNTMGNLKSSILPVYNSVKEFFTKFIKSSPEKPINEYNSEPNIYTHSKKLDLNDFCEAPAPVTSLIVSLPKEEENLEKMTEVSEEVIKKTEVTLSEHKKRKNRKQKRILSQNKKKMNKSGQENNSNKKKKTFNPDNFYQKGKNMNKNKKEKNRHAIECSIHEDFDNNFVIKDVVEEINTPIFHATKNSCFLVDSLKQVYTSAIPSVSSCKPQFISFTVEDFPTIQPSRQSQQQQNQSNYSTDEWNFIRNNQKKQFSRIRQYSECDSEDSFIVFSEESPKVTPSYINRPITLCQKFQKNFSPRQRNISECSDDSFVICFEDDPNRAADETFDYSSGSDSESDSETEGESVGHPPDSGFEDKKVNF